MATFTIIGTIQSKETKKPIKGLRVEAWDQDVKHPDLLGQSDTDATGNFSISFDDSYFKDNRNENGYPDVLFKIYRDGRLLENFPRQVFKNLRSKKITVTFELDDSGEGLPPVTKTIYKVFGKISTAAGDPVENMLVKLYDKSVTTELLLGESRTEKRGAYTIAYDPKLLESVRKTKPDILAKIFKENKDLLFQTKIYCNAPAQFELPVVLPAEIYRGYSEYARNLASIKSYVDEQQIKDLNEEQISYLECKTGFTKELIRNMVTAHRFAFDKEISAAAFYALIKEDFSESSDVLLSKRLPELRKILEVAIAENVISPERSIEETMAHLEVLKVENILHLNSENGNVSLGDIFVDTKVAEEKKKQFVQHCLRHEGTMEEFWKKLSENREFSNAEVDEIQFILQMAVLTQHHLPMIRALQQMRTNGTIDNSKALVSLDEEGWLELIQKNENGRVIGVPSNIAGDNDNEKAKRYARMLAESVEDAFPTAFVAARIEKDEVPLKADLQTFFGNNPDFEFRTHFIHRNAARGLLNFNGVENQEGLVRQLKAMQRLYKLSPRYQDMRLMMERGLDSSWSFINMGITRTREMFADKWSGEKIERIYGNAQQRATITLALVTKYNRNFDKTGMKVMPVGNIVPPSAPAGGGGSPAPDKITEDDIPTLSFLFGSNTLCACKHCRSVYSAAAYLVDLFQFLNKFPQTKDKTAKDILLDRRHDLAEIELSCANTNTQLPYIDLVLEILENASVGKGFVQPFPQTTLTTEELTANPENLNPKAYDKLINQVFPFTLPFDLWTTEVNIYLEHLGVPRHQLMESFFQPGSNTVPQTDPKIAAAYLGLTPEEQKIITNGSLDTAWDYWGLQKENNSVIDPITKIKLPDKNWVAVLKHVSVFLNRSKLSYKELLQLLDTKFVQQAIPALTIQGDEKDPDSCDLSKLTIKNLTDQHLHRIHRFIRLWRKLGWTMNELDEAIKALYDNKLIDLVKFYHLKRLQDELKTPVIEMLSWWHVIENIQSTPAEKTLFEKLFLNKTIDNPSEKDFKLLLNEANWEQSNGKKISPVFKVTQESLNILKLQLVPDAILNKLQTLINQEFVGEEKFLQELINTIGAENTKEYKTLIFDHATISNHVPILLAAFQVSAEELAILIQELKNNDLNLKNLSTLYRVVSFSKRLKISIGEFLSLRSMLEIDPFDVVHTENALRFVEKLDEIRESGFSITEFDYLLRNETELSQSTAPKEEFELLLWEIRKGLQKIQGETMPVTDPTMDMLKNKLAIILPSDKVEQALKIIPGPGLIFKTSPTGNKEVDWKTFIETQEAWKIFIDTYFSAFCDPVQAKTKLILSLDPANPNLSEDEKIKKVEEWNKEENARERITYLLDQLMPYLCRTLSENLIKQTLSSDLKLDVALSAFLLTGMIEIQNNQFEPVIKSQKQNDSPAISDFLSLHEEGLSATYYDNADPGSSTKQITRIDPLINFDWTASSPDPVIPLSGFSAQWQGILIPAYTETYSFFVHTENEVQLRINDEVIIDALNNQGQTELKANLKLKAGVLYTINLQFRKQSGNGRVGVFWTSHSVPKEIIPAANFYPHTTTDLFTAYELMRKASIVLNKFRVSEDELSYLIKNKEDFKIKINATEYSEILDLNDLVKSSKNLKRLFDGWERLANIFYLRDNLRLSSTTLFELFDAAKNSIQSGANEFLQKLGKAAKWNFGDLRFLAGNWDQGQSKFVEGFLSFKFPDDFKNEKALLRLLICFKQIRRVGLSASNINDWIIPVIDYQKALNFKRAVKAKYDEKQWLSIAKPLRDKLREQQRAALVAFLTSSPPMLKSTYPSTQGSLVKYLQEMLNMAGANPSLTLDGVFSSSTDKAVRNFQKAKALTQDGIVGPLTWGALDGRRGHQDSNDLYQYFLIDVEMDACMMTSRIVQANASIQLFIQRALMGLEKEVVPNEDAAKEWEWMKNYRVWEANRKVFLYAENWIFPELRDDKSPIFTELETELLQDEITKETAENVFKHYLEKLDTVAHLQLVGMYHEKSDGRNVVHIFGRTYGQPMIYYYRRFENENYWTPWEKIDLDIEGEHLIPIVWNRRLYLFWVIFISKDASELNQQLANVEGFRSLSDWEIRIAWSEYKEKKWSAKFTSKDSLLSPIAIKEEDTGSSKTTVYYLPDKRYYFFQASVISDWLEVRCYRRFLETSGDFHFVSDQQDYFNTDLNKVTIEEHKQVGKFVFKGCNGRVEAEAVDVDIPIIPEISPKNSKHHFMRYISHSPYTLKDGTFILKSYPEPNPNPFDFLVSHDIEDPHKPFTFFYQDNTRTFFVTYEGLKNNYIANPSNLMLGTGETTDATGGDSNKVNHEIISKKMMFQTFYHPYVCEFIKRLNKDGIDGLLRRDVQALIFTKFLWSSLHPENLPIGHIDLWKQAAQGVFQNEYKPIEAIVTKPYPIENVDFDPSNGEAYSLYNWELFFHAPLLIADRLNKNQKFEEAQKWFHYIFDPMAQFTELEKQLELKKDPAARFWKFLPFYNNYNLEGDAKKSILEIMALLHVDGTDSTLKDKKAKLISLIEQWRNDSFNTHLIARHRISAYQKTVVMKYIDNLIAWGDQLFRRDTIESINEATQLYIVAAEILGPRFETIQPRKEMLVKTYSQLEDEGIDEFSNSVVELEGVLNLPETGNGQYKAGADQLLAIGRSLYFCIPENEKLLSYWDTVEDRLFKIRHCMNIEGITRQLPLFEPPIDPALLVKAAAAGIDISSALNDLYAPLPHYRFSYMIQKAIELCQELKSLGSSLIVALEKKDGEEMALLRAAQEKSLLKAIMEVKKQQLKETGETLTSINLSKDVTQKRYDYYSTIENISEGEREQMNKLTEAQGFQLASQMASIESSLLFAIPDKEVGTSGNGPHGVGSFGGSHLGHVYKAISEGFGFLGSLKTYDANMASIKAGYDRRWNDWKLQEKLADAELKQISKQITAAEIREQIAEKELTNHELQIDHATEVEALMKSKYTNKELYSWMTGQISTLYFQAYQLAYDLAKKAERVYQFELGIGSSNFIQFGYWDSLKKGLLSGEKLHQDLRRLELAYLEQNKRSYEITKHLSLLSIDPEALLKFRETGVCEFDIPELLFDLDFPGQFMRKIKSVTITIPCIRGPYTNISATLTLLKSRVRKKTNNTDYTYSGIEDKNFYHNLVNIQSIATSTAQNDSGMFELNFRDERFLPFEGAGAISTWRLELPSTIRQFNYESIPDVILHMNYMAKEGGDAFKSQVQTYVEGAFNFWLDDMKTKETGIPRLFSFKQEFSTAWYKFLQPPPGGVQNLDVVLNTDHLPFFTKGFTIVPIGLSMYLLPVDPSPNDEWTAKVSWDGNTIENNTDPKNEFLASYDGKSLSLNLDITPIINPFSSLSIVLNKSGSTAIKQEDIADLMFIVYYKIEKQ